MDEQIEKVVDILLQAKNVVALTGAGISTESGIPDFRSPGGLWSKVDPGEFSIDRFLQNPGRFWRLSLNLKTSGEFDLASAEPNPAHFALAKMESLGVLKCVITQNVDNLHQRAGSVEVVEFHGNLLRAVCMKCKALEPIQNVEDRIASGQEETPRCLMCGGILKPDAIFFGEAIPSRALMTSQIQSQKCDALLVIGTSLQVFPAAQIPIAAKMKTPPATVIEINRDPSALHKQVTDVLVIGSASEIMTSLIERLEKELGETSTLQ
ncbi:MAG: NAD-dependent deacylase [Deltaproteobacteria bacterium]|nr:NAD-dependent deacylase [Deltaproteobacteria bacterium]